MPTTRTRRLAAALTAATAVALAPLAVAPANAAAAPAAASALPATTAATLPAAAPPSAAPAAAVGPLAAASQGTVRWVKADRAKVTKKRGRSSRVVARPDDGTRLTVLERRTRLLEVRLPNGKVGWIGKRHVTATPLRDVGGQRFTTKRVAITREVRGASRTVARAALGTKVTKLARTTGRDVNRVKVELPGGKTGWVSAKKLRTRDVWGQLARCESGGRPGIATGNGYYGMYQFTASTWRAVGGSGLPHRHSAREQTKRAQILQDRAGWGQWPHCTRKLGLR
ncbi:transglycosylase family protein [Isoptericola sp. S6320L]|uniref:transglycosylase family protein n=1 Tax=Isoptericola sp. S6320L TaxID=2926411 RepID=UPI00248AD1C5|nr:transglycosylase family protein [Isoptericola sp. S6320L]